MLLKIYIMKKNIAIMHYPKIRCIWYLVFSLSILLVSSCGNVLEKTPIDSFSDDAVWGDEALTEAFANTAYKSIPFGFQQLNGWRFLPYANMSCLLYTSDAADEEDSVDLGGRRIIKKKK